MFTGIYTALVTPFDKATGKIHRETYLQLIERQVKAKVDGLIIAGSTGEGQTLQHDEWSALIDIAIEFKSKIKILVSCGTSSTEETAKLVMLAEKKGVHGALVSTPPYNKPPQRGLEEHFKAITRFSQLPLMLYNIPGRTAINMLPETVSKLWSAPSIVSIKESSGSLEQMASIIKDLPQGKTLLAGDDSLSLPAWAIGASGVVSVLSNLVPQTTVKLWKLHQSGQQSEAQKLFLKLQKTVSALFVESNPIPIKWMLGHHLASEHFNPRLPLVPLADSLRVSSIEVLKSLDAEGLLG